MGPTQETEVTMPPESPTSKPSRTARPWWLPLAPWIFVALWSAGYTPVKIALQYSEPLFLLVLRYAGVCLLLIPAYLIVRPPLPRTRRAWVHLVLVGVMIQGIYFALANMAIGLGASAAGLGIVLALQPILVALIVPWVTGETVTGRAWLGLGLGLLGAAIVIVAKSGANEATTSGIVTAFAALLFITIGTVWEKRFGQSQHPIVANLAQCGVAGLVALLVALPLETFAVTWSWPFVVSLAYLVVGNSIVAMTLLLAMIRHGQATRASALFFLVPPGSAAMAWLLLGEPFPPAAIAGMAVAGIGVWLVRGR